MMSERTLWLYRSIKGDKVDICPGNKVPWQSGIVETVSYKLIRRLGIVGCKGSLH
jgi:hypothetical protein